MSRDVVPDSDSDKLRLLADWFDFYDEMHRTHTTPPNREIQQYLLYLADRLEKKDEPR